MGGGWSTPPFDHSAPRKDPVPIVQEIGWAPGPVWTGAENLASPTGIRSPDRPARSVVAVSTELTRTTFIYLFISFIHSFTYKAVTLTVIHPFDLNLSLTSVRRKDKEIILCDREASQSTVWQSAKAPLLGKSRVFRVDSFGRYFPTFLFQISGRS